MKNAPVQHFLEYAAFSLFRRFILSRSHAAARRLGAGLGRFAYRLMYKERALAMANLARVMPELNEERCKEIVRDCFAHFGANVFESISAERFDSDGLRRLVTVEGREHIEALKDAPSGYILTAGHFGMWEIGMYWIGLQTGTIRAVGRALDNPRLDRVARQRRERFGVKTAQKRGAIIELLTALRKGERVGVVIDQYVHPTAGAIPVSFFEHRAWTSPILAFLSIKTGAPVVHFNCVALGDEGYLLRIHPPIEPEGAGRAAELVMTERYLKLVEQDVRERPELWLWMHRRWRD